MYNPGDYHIITKKYSCLVDRPITKVRIYFIDNDLWLECNALWDTGTSHTLVADNLVEKYQLKSNGVRKVLQAGGKEPESKGCYLINLYLSKNLYLNKINISSIKLTKADILIGMDIIKWGNLLIENINNKTVFTFAYPKVKE